MRAAWRAVTTLSLASSSAAAQRTHLYLEAASESSPRWESTTTATPGEVVSVRVRVRYEPLGSTAFNAGFAGIVYQPMLSSWNGGDTLLPFSPALTPDDATYGRVYPFSSSNQFSSGASGELTSFVDGASTLRFAGSKNVTPTTNLAWGVSSAQRLQSQNPTGYNSDLDVVVFRFGFIAGTGGRTLVASTPLEWISNARALWYPCGACLGLMNAPVTPETIHPAAITIVPGVPAGVGLAMACGWLVPRRARRSP